MLVLSPQQTDNFHLTLAALSPEAREKLDALMPEAVIAAIKGAPHADPAHSSQRVDTVFGTSADDEGAGEMRRALVALLCLDLPRRITSYNLPPAVHDAYRLWLDRLAGALVSGAGGYDAHHWARDIRLATGLSVPCTRTHLIDLTSPVTFASALAHVRGGHGYSAPLRWTMAKGWGEWLRIQPDDRDTADFTPDGWADAWLASAGLLERYPGLVGATASGWFLDPALEKVSPNLSYVRETAERAGAFLIYEGPSEEASRQAAVASGTRRALIESRRYTPRAWRVVWPRRALLAWAAQERARRAEMADILDAAVTRPAPDMASLGL